MEFRLPDTVDLWPLPTLLDGQNVTLENNSSEPIKVKKGAIIAQIRPTIEHDVPVDPVETNNPLPRHTKTNLAESEDFRLVQVDPQKQLTSSERNTFYQLHEKYAAVFNRKIGSYNGKSGRIMAKFEITATHPPPSKARIPRYNSDMLRALQDEFDKLEDQGILVAPEELGITVRHTSPSFLVKKKSGKNRLVTMFVEINKFIRPLPVKMQTPDDVLRAISRWKFIIQCDLTSSFFQIPAHPDSIPYLGTMTPFRGLRVYTRAAMGIRNSSEWLEELLSRVLGDLLKEGIVVKIADDLFVGGDTTDDLQHNWSRVLERLNENGLQISAEKTIIAPKATTILGWHWEEGTVSVSDHRVSTLQTCPKPRTVTKLRSFIGCYKAMKRCIPNYSSLMAPLEEAVGGKSSSEVLIWNEELTEAFRKAQESLKTRKTLTVPRPGDRLVITTDASVSNCALGGTLFVIRQDEKLVAEFFSAKLTKSQLKWLPCELEALAIKASVQHFAPFIREAATTTKILTDSRPCVQAFEKLGHGDFSMSARVSSFLVALNTNNVQLDHISGSRNDLSDFSSRNPVTCTNENCQVCKFLREEMESPILAVTFEDIDSGRTKLPFSNPQVWRQLQSEDPLLRRAFSQLTNGTRPGKKEKQLGDLRRILRVATIGARGLLVVKKSVPYGPDRELIIVPEAIAPGLINSLHVKLQHPSKSQLCKVFDKYFYAFNAHQLVNECTEKCLLCSAMKSIPRELFNQSSSDIPDSVGAEFFADVMCRARQKVFVVRDVFSSFTRTCFLPNESHETLREAILITVSDFRHPSGTKIRVDGATGFLPLIADPFLRDQGIEVAEGRKKNPNKNAVCDKAVLELESELKRLSPNGHEISASTLAIATANLNSRVRFTGLSAREIVLRRDQYTMESLTFKDDDISSDRAVARMKNHLPSARSKACGGPEACRTPVNVGDIVYMKREGNKHVIRDYYLVTAVDHNLGQATVQKFVGTQLRARKYDVTFEEIYLAPTSKDRVMSKRTADSDMEPMETEEEGITSVRDQGAPEQSHQTLRRSTRLGRPPDRYHSLDWRK